MILKWFLALSVAVQVQAASVKTNMDPLSFPEPFRDQVFQILKRYQRLENLSVPQREVSLDLEDGFTTTIYNKPGIFNTQDCQKDAENKNRNSQEEACKGLGWPDNKARLMPTGSLDFRLEEDEDGNKTLRVYTEVKFSYDRGGLKEGTGWISQDRISFKPVTSMYSEKPKSSVKEKVKEVCPPAASKSLVFQLRAAKKNMSDLAEVQEETKKHLEDKKVAHLQQISSVAEKLADRVGKCMLKPPNVAPKSFSNEIVYDQFVLPSVLRTSLPQGIQKEDGSSLTSKDLVDVDAMARTLFAEIANCAIDVGAQYPMAVARVIRNREEAMRKNPAYVEEFVKYNSQHNSAKDLLSKAATSPVLMSSWNQSVIDFKALNSARDAEMEHLQKQENLDATEAKKKAEQTVRADSETKRFYKPNDSGLLQTLCPPSDPEGLCYRGSKPDKNLNLAWQIMLKVAVETVLFPKQFEARTAALAGIKHYTSNRTSFYDFIPVKGKEIGGRELSNSRCLNLWKQPQPKKK